MSYEIAGRMSWLVSWLGNVSLNVSSGNVTSAWAGSNHASADDELISQTLAARQLRKSVEQLPANERQVLLLHVNNGLTYWEIAARLNMDEEVVLRDLAHAYSQLRLELSADELRR